MHAMMSVFLTAAQSAGDLSDVNIEMYASNVKPFEKLKLELFEKLYTMMRIIGA